MNLRDFLQATSALIYRSYLQSGLNLNQATDAMLELWGRPKQESQPPIDNAAALNELERMMSGVQMR